LPLHRASGSSHDEAIALENLGLAAAGAGDSDEAVVLLEQAIAIAERSEAPREAASASVDLAKVLIDRGEPVRATALLQAAHATYLELADRAKSADCLDGFAAIAVAEGRPEDALRLLAEAASVRASIGSVRQPDQESWVRRAVGDLSISNADSVN